MGRLQVGHKRARTLGFFFTLKARSHIQKVAQMIAHACTCAMLRPGPAPDTVAASARAMLTPVPALLRSLQPMPQTPPWQL